MLLGSSKLHKDVLTAVLMIGYFSLKSGEFQFYRNNRSNSYVHDGHLYIKPTLTADDFGEEFLTKGTLDMNGNTPNSM